MVIVGEKVDNYSHERTKDSKRKLFAIIVDEETTGEVQIKCLSIMN